MCQSSATWLFVICGVDVVCRAAKCSVKRLCVCLCFVLTAVVSNVCFDKELIMSVSLTAQDMGICGMIYKTSKKRTKTVVFMA